MGNSDLIMRVHAAARQEQFLEVVSAEEARARFERHIDLSPLSAETVVLADAHTRVLAQDVVAEVDAPPFDRSNVDGFAVRAADTWGASDASPKMLTLNNEVVACGHAPVIALASGTCTAIATGGVIPRGADAVLMIEQTELIEDGQPRIQDSSFHTPDLILRAARPCCDMERASVHAKSGCLRPAGSTASRL